MTIGNTGSILPKWQMALIIGTPIAIGIGFLCYRRGRINNESNKDKTAKTSDNTELSKKENNLSLCGDIPTYNSSNDNLLDSAQKLKVEGNRSFKKGKYDEAIDFYSKAIEACPKEMTIDLATFYQNRAAAYEQLQQWLHVKENCTSALEYNPKYTKAFYRRARAYEQLDDFSNCLEDVTATCLLEGFQNNATLIFADRILKKIGQLDAIKFKKTKANTVLPSNSFIQTYFASFTHDPLKYIRVDNFEQKGFIKAKTALDSLQYEDVISACTDEISTSESESNFKNEAMVLRGTFLLLCGNFLSAFQDFDAVILNSEADKKLRVNALIKRASLHLQNNEHDLGMKDFAAAENLDPYNADIYHQRGQVYLLIENLQLAIDDFRKTVKLAPEQGVAYVQKCYAEYRLAVAMNDQTLLPSIINDFKSALKKYPKCVECFSVFAQVLTEQSQYEQADTLYDDAIKMSPSNASLFVHKAILYLQWKGDIENAVEFMNKAITIDEKCELAFETLGTIEVQRGNLEQAIYLFNKALDLAKTDAEMMHLYSLRNAASAQLNVAKKLGFDMSHLSSVVSI